MHDNVIRTHKQYNLSNLEPQFKRYLTAVNKLSSVSVKNYLSDFRYFVGWFHTYSDSFDLSMEFSSVSELLEAINEDIVLEYRKYLVNEMLPYRTINRRLSSLRKFFSFALSQQWISTNPAKKVTNVPKKPVKTDSATHGTTDVLIRSFVSDLKSDGLDSQWISQAENDVNEFFAIINS